jgi:hypothetical protein
MNFDYVPRDPYVHIAQRRARVFSPFLRSYAATETGRRRRHNADLSPYDGLRHEENTYSTMPYVLHFNTWPP